MSQPKEEIDQLVEELRRLTICGHWHNSVSRWFMIQRIIVLANTTNPLYINPLCVHSRIAIYETNLLISHLRGWAYPNHDIMEGRRLLQPSEVKAKIDATPNLYGCRDVASPFSAPIPIRKKA